MEELTFWVSIASAALVLGAVLHLVQIVLNMVEFVSRQRGVAFMKAQSEEVVRQQEESLRQQALGLELAHENQSGMRQTGVLPPVKAGLMVPLDGGRTAPEAPSRTAPEAPTDDS